MMGSQTLGLRAQERDLRLAEALGLSLAFVVYTICVQVFRMSITPQIIITVVFLGVLIALSWINFRKGMHPLFLFLGLLALFQAGGLLAYIFSGNTGEPLMIYPAEIPFEVPQRVQSETLLLIILSALLIYLVPRLADSQVEYEAPANERLLPILVAIILVCLPFHFWKNYEYLLYVRAHGGYLAIFRSDEHIAEVGLAVRVISQLCSAAFVVYFVYERPGRRMFFISLAYFAISVVELLIGLRGKVMLLFVCFLFLWKLKRHTGFGLRGLILLGLVLAAVAQSVAIFRENKAQSLNAMDLPAMFLSGEGVSLGVTEAAIAFRPQFSPYRLAYLVHGVRSIFQSEATPQAISPQGQVLDNDTSMFLNRSGFVLGYGTGGSYLAEGYIFGGVVGVIIESLLVAWLLIWIARYLSGWAAPFAWSVMTSVVYLPRANFITLLSVIAHSCIGIAIVFAIAVGIQRSLEYFRHATPLEDVSPSA